MIKMVNLDILDIDEIEKIRQNYSNIKQFDFLENEKLLLVKKYKKNDEYHIYDKHNIVGTKKGELYASLILMETPILFYNYCNEKRINHIKKILEKKFSYKIITSKRDLFGLEELSEMIKCIKTPKEYDFRQSYYYKK